MKNTQSGVAFWEDSEEREHEVDFVVTFHIDSNYGADADGNRGVSVSHSEFDYEYPKNISEKEKKEIDLLVESEACDLEAFLNM